METISKHADGATTPIYSVRQMSLLYDDIRELIWGCFPEYGEDHYADTLCNLVQDRVERRFDDMTANWERDVQWEQEYKKEKNNEQ